MHGPFDYHLTRKLILLAKAHDLPVARDIFHFYRSDVAAALEAGAGARAALVAFGVVIVSLFSGWQLVVVFGVLAALTAAAMLLLPRIEERVWK